jgi:hypothetical protein
MHRCNLFLDQHGHRHYHYSYWLYLAPSALWQSKSGNGLVFVLPPWFA